MLTERRLWLLGVGSFFMLRAVSWGQDAPVLKAGLNEAGDAVQVSVEGGVVEAGWVLQDSYEGTGWRDLGELTGEGFSEALSRVPSGRRYFRAVVKAPATRQGALDAARAKWEAWRPERYQYRYRTSTGFLDADDLVLVEGDERLENTSLLPPDFFPFRAEFGETVDELFDRLQRAVDRPAHRMDVRYHPDFGYPERGYVDLEELLADEEWGFSVTVTPVEPGEALAAARSRWGRAGLSRYEYEVKSERGGRLNPNWDGRVRVEDGVASVVDGEEPAVGHLVSTVEELFARIGEGIADGKVVSAAYDPETGAPVFFSIDWYLTQTDGPGERRWITLEK